jgi:hypothetical protein
MPGECMLLGEGDAEMLGQVPQGAVFVNMLEWGFTTGPALFTYGANPCLAVVIHDKQSGCGALAHIGMPSATWATSAAYSDKIIDLMMQKLVQMGARRTWQVFLFGSRLLAMHPNGSRGFARNLATRLGVDVSDNLLYDPLAPRSLDYGPAAQIVYAPVAGMVAKLDDRELGTVRGSAREAARGATVENYPS